LTLIARQVKACLALEVKMTRQELNEEMARLVDIGEVLAAENLYNQYKKERAKDK
jgi:hypothetical protein